MSKSKTLMGVSAALGMLVLILDGQTAIRGASEGLELCIRTVIPSLFPFFLLSITLTGAVSGTGSPLLRPLSAIFGTPKGTEALLLTSFLGGYPVGAQCIARGYQNGQIDKTLAHRMLFFCNNAGPSFIFGIAALQFSSPLYGWLIWAIQLLSAAAVARSLPAYKNAAVRSRNPGNVSFTEALQSALRVMATVCGWVVIFRVILAFLDRWLFWLAPTNIQVLLTGLLELANGCCNLSRIENEGIRLILCSSMLSFGGLCVFMQTSSVLQGLSRRVYLTGKCLQTIYATALSIILQWFLPGRSGLHPVTLIGILLPLIPWYLRKMKNSYSVSARSIV